MTTLQEELEKQNKRREAIENPPPTVERTQVRAANRVWSAGVVSIDALTAYIIGWILLSPLWVYGVIWFLVGAGGLLWSEWIRARVGNNNEQRKIAKLGINVSAISVALMALVSGGLWVSGVKSLWMSVVIEVASVILFFFHVLQAYRYRDVDDDLIMRTMDARDLEDHERELKNIANARLRVERAKERTDEKNRGVSDYGNSFSIAYGATTKGVKQQQANRKQTDPTNGGE